MGVDSLNISFDSSNGADASSACEDYLFGFPLPVETADLCSAVRKLIRNVNEWAHSAGLLTACVEDGHLVITVEDFGVGLYHHLNADYGIRSAAEAAERAFEAGMTSSGDVFRGRGLTFCLSLTERTGTILLETIGGYAAGWSGEIQTAASTRGRDAGTSVTLRFQLPPFL